MLDRCRRGSFGCVPLRQVMKSCGVSYSKMNPTFSDSVFETGSFRKARPKRVGAEGVFNRDES